MRIEMKRPAAMPASYIAIGLAYLHVVSIDSFILFAYKWQLSGRLGTRFRVVVALFCIYLYLGSSMDGPCTCMNVTMTQLLAYALFGIIIICLSTFYITQITLCMY